MFANNVRREQDRDNDTKMGDIVHRGIRDMIRERNAARNDNLILTQYVIADVAHVITQYTYGEDRTIPDVAAYNLTHGNMCIRIGDRELLWSNYGLDTAPYRKYSYWVSIPGTFGCVSINMFDIIDFILTGFSLGAFEGLARLLYRRKNASFADIDSGSEESIGTLRAMQTIRTRFLTGA